MSSFILNSSGKPFRIREGGTNPILYSPPNIVAPGTTTTTTTTMAGANWDMAQHLPGGLTLRTDNLWSSVLSTGWLETVREGGPQTIITPGDLPPDTGTTALRQDWNGVNDGQSPYFSYYFINGSQQFFSTIFRLGPTFTFPTGEIKWLTWLVEGGFIWIGIYRAGSFYGDPNGATGTGILRFIARGTNVAGGNDLVNRLDVRAATTTIPLNQWVKVSVMMESAPSPARVRCWFNSSLVLDTDDGVLAQGGGSPITMSWGDWPRIQQYQQGSTWGGGNGSAAGSTIIMEYARTAIWTN